MARCARILLAACLLVCLPVTGWAGDVFTGFQIDNKSQYFGYLGVRTPLYQMAGGTDLFIQAFSAGLGYSFKDRGQTLDANVQFIVPSLGISQKLGNWTLSALAGPQLRRIEEERLGTSSLLRHQVGGYGQLEALYWHEKGSLHIIGSYADLDDFFWGRIRGKRLISDIPKSGCCAHYLGYDLAAMGNGDFRAVQTGPLYEVAIGKFYVLGKVGYQYSNVFHSGVYGGLEIYFPF